MDKPYCSPEIWGGIECTINRVDQQYFDQLLYTGHYNRPGDLAQIAELGIKKIRYPVLWEKHQPVENSPIDWSWTRVQLEELRSRNIDVIAGLVHHGSGPSFTQLNDARFPELLAKYAGEVAEQFPWIEHYTPVNEPLTTARFSGLYGMWYPHHKNARSFMQMLLNELKGVVLSMQAIRKVNPNAKLVQTEDLGKTYSTPALAYQARFENERRWLTFDILCGRFNPQHKLWKYFTRLAIPKEDFYFFLDNPCVPDIFGFNHYLTSERFLDEKSYLYPQHTHGGNGRDRYADVEAVRVHIDQPTGIEHLMREAWERYHEPIAVTEVHLHCHREEQLRWFKQVWEASGKLVSEGVDIRAITSWALLGSYGWNRLLTEPGGDYEPGAFDLRNGQPRKTALARYIEQIAHTNKDDHHLSRDKGWWRRATRLIYTSTPSLVPPRPAQHAPLLIIGKNGTLGRAFARVCEERFLNYRLLDRQDCDISNPASIEEAMQRHKPWAVINAAGYVRVDDAESDAEACFRDNTEGPRNLAEACSRKGVQLLTFSSDLVFDGKSNTPYLEQDETNPLNIYGRSKAASEIQVLEILPSALVVRTSAFFSPWDEYNFVHQLRRSLARYEPFTVAGDLHVSPTYVPHLVHAALDLLVDGEHGIWHLANEGSVTWSDFAHDVARRFDLDTSLIQTVPAAELNLAAVRPSYTVLGSSKGQLLPSLEAALDEYVSAHYHLFKREPAIAAMK
jgi:dTDP-4-dehydrorhamnose reductase